MGISAPDVPLGAQEFVARLHPAAASRLRELLGGRTFRSWVIAMVDLAETAATLRGLSQEAALAKTDLANLRDRRSQLLAMVGKLERHQAVTPQA